MFSNTALWTRSFSVIYKKTKLFINLRKECAFETFSHYRTISTGLTGNPRTWIFFANWSPKWIGTHAPIFIFLNEIFLYSFFKKFWIFEKSTHFCKKNKCLSSLNLLCYLDPLIWSGSALHSPPFMQWFSKHARWSHNSPPYPRWQSHLNPRIQLFSGKNFNLL